MVGHENGRRSEYELIQRYSPGRWNVATSVVKWFGFFVTIAGWRGWERESFLFLVRGYVITYLSQGLPAKGGGDIGCLYLRVCWTPLLNGPTGGVTKRSRLSWLTNSALV